MGLEFRRVLFRSLGVDRTNYLVDESGIVVYDSLIIRKVGPSGINRQLVVLATTVYSRVVLVNHVLALLSVSLNDEFLHLLDSQVYRDNTRDTEESGLEDRIGTVT